MEDSSLLAQYESHEKWTRARRGVLVERIVSTFRNSSVDLIPFEEVRTRLHLTQKYCRGQQDVELAHIRGSVGRYRDFTSAFLPRRDHLRQRWERVSTMASTHDMPPIELYQVGDAYFVVDGNHRVSIARQEGMKTIAAYVWEFVTPVGLSADADLDEVIIKSEYVEFLDKTRLNKLRPGQEIVFTTPGRYRDLECLITMFREALEETRGEVISYQDALLLWYDTVYTPAVHEIRKSGAMERFSDRTEADLFIWMWQHQQRLLEQYSSSPVHRVVEAVSSLVRWPWSRMKRLYHERTRGGMTTMIKIKQLPTRQRLRKALLFVSLLLFPATLYYFSPMLILQGASEGIVNGSMIVFGLMFLSALFVGRLWCGWACPAGALQEFGQPINNKRTPGGKFNWVKWVIWIPWIGLIIALAIGAGGFRAVDPFFQLETGVTLALPLDDGGPPWFMIYYIIIALFLGLALIFGRRAGCHTVCWMAPFMIIGRWIRNRVRWPSLRLAAQPGKCSDCLTCTRNCPMSLDVNGMVQRADMENDECILCGNCVDGCPKDAIRFSFSAG